MSAFFGQEFLTAQYFRPNYLHGAGGVPPTQDGRSGYWRLFFMQAQEEALKDEKVVEHTGRLVTSENVDRSIAVQKKPTKKKKPVFTAPQNFDVPEIPPFRRTPVYTTPSTYEQLANLPRDTLAVEVRTLEGKVYQFAQHLAAKQKRARARRRAAAFLLMAA